MRDHIILRRSGALGDVILATPVLRRLRLEFPDALITVQTGYPDVFAHSPHLTETGGEVAALPVLIDLNLSYENRPTLHIVQAYMMEAFGDPGEPADLQQSLGGLSEAAPPPSCGGSALRMVAVHAALAGWKNRTLPRHIWQDVLTGLRDRGLTPVLVGGVRDVVDDPAAGLTVYLGAPLQTQAALIAKCVGFIGSDSAMLHLAGCTETPIVGVFTSARPETRLPFRHGVLGWRCAAVMPDLPCIGCQTRRPPPVTDEHCERGDTLCIERIGAGEILAALQSLIEV